MTLCLLQAINTRNLKTQKKNFIVWSVNRDRQLKNRMSLYLYILLVSSGHFDCIEHKFIIFGHSFSLFDKDFALIEKRVKCFKLQVIADIIQKIKEARFSKPSKILGMSRKPFLNIDKAMYIAM